MSYNQLQLTESWQWPVPKAWSPSAKTSPQLPPTLEQIAAIEDQDTIPPPRVLWPILPVRWKRPLVLEDRSLELRGPMRIQHQ